jgi:uncharacterized protein YoxC
MRLPFFYGAYMEIDQIKFMNLVMEKTNKKLNEMLAQVIVLESQLQLVVEANNKLTDDLNKLNKKEKKTEFTN